MEEISLMTTTMNFIQIQRWLRWWIYNPHPRPPTYTESIWNAKFSTFPTVHTDWQTNGWTDGRTCDLQNCVLATKNKFPSFRNHLCLTLTDMEHQFNRRFPWTQRFYWLNQFRSGCTALLCLMVINLCNVICSIKLTRKKTDIFRFRFHGIRGFHMN